MAIPDALSCHYTTYDTEMETDEITNIFKDMVKIAVKTGNSETNKSLDKQSDLLQRLNFLEEQNAHIPKIRTIENSGPNLLLLQEASTSRGGDTFSEEIDQPVNLSQLAQMQQEDKHYLKLINYLQFETLLRRKSAFKYLQTQSHKYWVDNQGILRKINEMFPIEKELPPAVLPKALWDEVIDISHNSPTGGY